MSTGSLTQPATYPANGPQSPGPGPSAASGGGPGPSNGPGGLPAPPRRGLFRMRDARLRTKLGLILFVPLLAVLILATARLISVGTQAYDAAQTADLTRLSADVADLGQALHDERMTGARYLSTPSATPDDFQVAIKATDARIQNYNVDRRTIDHPPSAIATRLRAIDANLNTIDGTRQTVLNRNEVAVPEAVLRYGVIINNLVAFGDVLGEIGGQGKVPDGLRTLAAFGRAKAGAAAEEASAYAAQVSGDMSPQERTDLIAIRTDQQAALDEFALVASSAKRRQVQDIVTGDAVTAADTLSDQLSRDGRADPAAIAKAYGAVVDLMYKAQQQLGRQTVADASADSTRVTGQATIEGLLVIIVLVVAVTLGFFLARSLNQSLRRLREGALAVANRDLPDAVARLRDVRNLGDGGPEDIVRQVQNPIQLPTRDEVGQVAQAFNVVHREAVRIAAEQAALRTSVSAMFLNLARRSQNLVDRMIGELDQIERGEEDPKRLAQLFELDHLATRMRRNDENLLVLAGADSSAPRREDALLIDALRAAQSEVELYNRIEFGTVDTDISVAAHAVNDVVRLTAEILDNATRFSPPNTTVVADARRIRDYVVIQVEDRGLGMSAEAMEALNRRLAEPPSVDVGAFRMMGLAVVGLLAGRYSIRVELRANLEGGTLTQITLPSHIVILPGRSIEAPGKGVGRVAQLDAGPFGRRDAMPGSATATLAAIAPDPWQLPGRPQHPSLPMMPSQRTSAPVSPAAPRQLPSTPRRDDLAPTANRPSLPTRTPQPVDPVPADQPWGRGVPSPRDALGTPTVAYPTVARTAPPDRQVAAGFASTDGSRFPPSRTPVSPDPSGWGAALAAMPPVPPTPAPAPPEPRAEAPIFLQMQASWFKGHDDGGPDDWSMPTAGYAPPPNPARDTIEDRPAAAVAAGSRQNGARPASAGAETGGPAPASRAHTAPEDRWRTAADEGWRRAMAAAEPQDAGTTRSGLPKRVPQAQLVPGGVQNGPRNQNRRSPDEVRGLLSAYHRGVQRGRTAGSAEAAGAPAPKENDQ